MSIDNQLRNAGQRINVELEQIPVPQPPQTGFGMRQIAAVAAALIVVIGGSALWVALAGNGTQVASEGTVSTTTESLESVLQTDPLVVRADDGPVPMFETSGLGIEQPIAQIFRVTAFEQAMFSEERRLTIEEAVAIGYLPGTDRGVLVGSGIISDPMQAGFGGAGQCVSVSTSETDGYGECHLILSDTQVRPIGTSIVGKDWVGWSFLPEDASVVVLTVDGVDRFWQRPRGGIGIFAFTPTPASHVELRVLDSQGVEIARGDQTPPDEPVEPTVEPIRGYGDYSNVAFDDIDPLEVTALIAECVNDQGFAATLDPSGDGIRFDDVTGDQLPAYRFALAACQAGLNLPEPPK